MEREIIEKLAIAEQFSHNAQYAGVARQAVADGYSSLDALFSAILIDAGENPPKNHRRKLEAVRDHAPNVFATREERSENSFSYWGGIPWGDIEAFYSEWLESRYEAFEMSASTAKARVTSAVSANQFVIRWLAEKHGKDWFDLWAVVRRATYGYHESAIEEGLGRAHDYLFSEAEAIGERIGRRLGFKMASTTNFCGADIIAGDDVTRGLIEQDQEIADHAVEVYISFCRLMDKVRTRRAEIIRSENPDMDHGTAFDQATDFMLSMKTKYHGETLSDTGKTIANVLAQSFGRFDQDVADEE